MSDLAGKQIGKLTVLSLEKKGEFSFSTTWRCRCSCGREVTFPAILLKNGLVSSCGCEGGMTKSDLAKANRGEVEGTNIFQLRSALDGVLFETNKTGVRGVYFNKRDKRFWAVIGFQGKRITIGRYKDLDEAAKARKEAEQILYVEFLNYYESEVKESIEAGNGLAAVEMIREVISGSTQQLDVYSYRFETMLS